MHINALVGPSGTGKSHRALLVAQELKIDAIIDDGLLIQGSRIIAGTSAKKQTTAIGAIKTALFTDDQHALEVIEQIKLLKPERILILGTSNEMVNKIAWRLMLPLPELYLSIEDIASAKEINRARKIREKYGKHVIPAPTVEVKPRLSGTLTDPLQTFLRKKHPHTGRSSQLWVNQTVVRPTFNFFGKFYIANDAIKQIIEGCLAPVEQILKIQHMQIETNALGVNLSLDLVIKYEQPLPPTLRLAQMLVKDTIEFMTALHVLRVDVFVRKIIVSDEHLIY